jgi:3-hydroxyacyl-CoA dehydrogenase
VDFKLDLYAHLDAIAPKDVLLISSSSGIPSSQFTANCKQVGGKKNRLVQ